MPSGALTAQGIKIKRGAGSPLTYTDIPEIISFNGPGGNAQVLDITTLDSAAIEKLIGLADEGQLSFDINFVPDNAVHAALRSDRNNQSLVPIRIVFTDGGATQWDFNAYVQGFTVQGGVNAPLRATVTLEISGAITES